MTKSDDCRIVGMIDELLDGAFGSFDEIPPKVRNKIRCSCGSREFEYVEKLCDHVMVSIDMDTGEITTDEEYPDSYETYIQCARCQKEWTK